MDLSLKHFISTVLILEYIHLLFLLNLIFDIGEQKLSIIFRSYLLLLFWLFVLWRGVFICFIPCETHLSHASLELVRWLFVSGSEFIHEPMLDLFPTLLYHRFLHLHRWCQNDVKFRLSLLQLSLLKPWELLDIGWMICFSDVLLKSDIGLLTLS
jgi:hypothetical protein